MKDRLELNGGTITGGTGYEIGQTVYILSVFTDGAESPFRTIPAMGPRYSMLSLRNWTGAYRFMITLAGGKFSPIKA